MSARVELDYFSPIGDYFPIDIDFISVDKICDSDLYLQAGPGFVLYRSSKLPFTTDDKNRLLRTKNHQLFVRCKNNSELRQFYQKNLKNVLDQETVPTPEKARILHFCVAELARDIFTNLQPQKAIEESKPLIENTIEFISKEPQHLVHFLELSNRDPYLLSHSVNVMTLVISLMSLMRINDPRMLQEAGIGALFHDIGKSKIDHDILEKPSPLDEEEWHLIKKHPHFGVEILNSGQTPDRSRNIVLQHHERLNGSGYPHGLAADSLSLPSRIVAICDAYDAMTSHRAYQKAIKPFDAFKKLMGDAHRQFDQNIILQLIQLLKLKP